VVLIYHRVGAGSGLEVDLDVGIFRDQIAELAESGAVVDIESALELLAAPVPPSDDRVVITFDDGTADFADHVVPVLVEHQVPATLYVATDFVDRGVPFPANGTPLSWSALSECAATGLVTVGSHTHQHALLDRLPEGEAEVELDRSIELIEDRVGTAVRHFAYPKAVAPSAANERAVRRRFASAALAGTRVNPYGRTDVHRLARSPVQVSDGMGWFRRKVSGGMRLEDDLRSLANRRRYAGQRT
jgi:peptidoglycan/xylan/chitin deacetylase (PgdA/CDA1 family)